MIKAALPSRTGGFYHFAIEPQGSLLISSGHYPTCPCLRPMWVSRAVARMILGAGKLAMVNGDSLATSAPHGIVRVRASPQCEGATYGTQRGPVIEEHAKGHVIPEGRNGPIMNPHSRPFYTMLRRTQENGDFYLAMQHGTSYRTAQNVLIYHYVLQKCRFSSHGSALAGRKKKKVVRSWPQKFFLGARACNAVATDT